VRPPRRSLTLVTGPAAEPVILDEAKAWLRIDGTDSDAQLAALITASYQLCEQWLRRSLISQTWKLTLDLAECPGGEPWWDGAQDGAISSLYGGLPQTVELPKGPVQSITSVTTYDLDDTSSTFASTNYRVDSAGERLVLNYGALWPSNLRAKAAAEITYVTGYGATSTSVPQPIKTGILIQTATLYEQRGMCGDPDGVAPGARQLWNPYRVLGSRG
jgi:hypothetical protein